MQTIKALQTTTKADRPYILTEIMIQNFIKQHLYIKIHNTAVRMIIKMVKATSIKLTTANMVAPGASTNTEIH